MLVKQYFNSNSKTNIIKQLVPTLHYTTAVAKQHIHNLIYIKCNKLQP